MSPQSTRPHSIVGLIIVWAAGGLLLSILSGDLVAGFFSVMAMIEFPIFADSKAPEPTDDEEEDEE